MRMRSFGLLIAVYVMVWLTVIALLGYVVVHFILKFW